MSIKIAVRGRPMLPKELNSNNSHSIEYCGDRKSVIIAGAKNFTLDNCFDEDSSQVKIYEEFISPLVGEFLKGWNCSILAYGPTGSGKTYTMGSEYNGPTTNSEDMGIIPRMIAHIFEEIKKEHDEISLKISFLEILNDNVYDILSPNRNIVKVQDTGNDIKLNNLLEVPVDTLESALTELSKGVKARTYAKTELNPNSSRSHAFCILKMQRITENSILESKLHLVDLAGSEDARRANTKGERFNEGVRINTSLHFLGNVLTALSTKSSHIPYRSHALTRILRESLNGTSYTRMIACISPNKSSIPETISTLRYAACARNLPFYTLPRLGKERNRFQAELDKVLPTPQKHAGDKLSVCLFSPALNLSVQSTSKTEPSSVLSSTAVRGRPPPPPKFQLSPEPVSQHLPVEDFLSPLAEKIHSIMNRRLTETVEKTVLFHLDSRPKKRGTSVFLDEEVDQFLSLRENQQSTPTQSATQADIMKLISPVAHKVRDLMAETLLERFKELESKLNKTENIPAHVSPVTPLKQRRAVLNDMTNTTVVPEKGVKKRRCTDAAFSNLNAKSNDKTNPSQDCVAPEREGQKKRRCTDTEFVNPSAKGRCRSPVQTRRRTLMSLNIPLINEEENDFTPKSDFPRVTLNTQVRCKPTSVPAPDPTVVENKAKQENVQKILTLLNTASIKQLQTLPVIGPKTAYQIHTYRSLNGSNVFQTLEDVKKVGLPQNTYKRFLKSNFLI